MPSDIHTEKQLLEQLSAGDEAAFRKLFDRYTPKLMRYTWSMTKSRVVAEELVQDCFLKIWASRSRMAEVADFDSYIFIMARNKVLDHFRKLSADTRIRQETWNGMQALHNPVQESVDFSESRRLIGAALEELSAHKQKIFQLSRYEGLSHEEIAEKLGISRNTVKNHLVETLRHIREFLQRNSDPIVVLIITHFLHS